MENFISNGEVKIWTDITGSSEDNYIMLCNGGPGSPDYLEPVANMIDGAAHYIWLTHYEELKSILRDFAAEILL